MAWRCCSVDSVNLADSENVPAAPLCSGGGLRWPALLVQCGALGCTDRGAAVRCSGTIVAEAVGSLRLTASPGSAQPRLSASAQAAPATVGAGRQHDVPAAMV